MSKPRGKIRLITQIMNGGAQLRRVGERTITLEFPDQPGYHYIFTKKMPPDFICIATFGGMVFRCKGCGAQHMLSWGDPAYTRDQDLVQQPGGPAFYNILCVDGTVRVALPGERFEGKVTCLQHITSEKAIDGLAGELYDNEQ